MISFATAARAKSYGRLVHVWLPEDADEAHGLIVDLSRGHRQASVNEYDHARFSDLVSGSGGFSHHPVRGAAPSSGWMVSLDAHKEPSLGAVHELKDLKPEHISAHREGAAHHLGKDGVYQGGWVDRGTGHVYLDVSKHFPEEQEGKARTFALRHRQKAYYHLADGEEKYLHPQHDPKMLEDHNGWAAKYKDHMMVPHEYHSYEHLYPPSPDLQRHLDEHAARTAYVNRSRMRASRHLR